MRPISATTSATEVERAARRRQPHREGEEDLAHAQQLARAATAAAARAVVVEPAREEPVGVARVVREQPLQILGA